MARKRFSHLGFRVCNRSERGYAFLDITVEELGQVSSSRTLVLFSWQANRDGGTNREWYGFQVRIEATSGASLKYRSKVAAAIVPPSAYSDMSPQDLVARLLALGIDQVVYDSRLSECVRLADVLPSDVRSWRDDWRATGRSSCTVGCLAASEEVARIDIARKLAERQEYEDILLAWVAVGRPVYKTGDVAPEVTPWEVLLDPAL